MTWPNVSIGTRVVLPERGQYILGKANPVVGSTYECEGRVVSISSPSVGVKWDNGSENVYYLGELKPIYEEDTMKPAPKRITWKNGETVYNNKPDSKAFGLFGETDRVAASGCMYVKWSNGKEFFYSAREVEQHFTRGKKRTKIAEESTTKWSFSVISSAAISEQEIKKNLTRQHPMAIVQVSTGITLVMIHEGLLSKAEVLGMVTPEAYYGNGIYYLQTTQVSEWVSWAKTVKKASWGEERVPAKVTVSLPTI